MNISGGAASPCAPTGRSCTRWGGDCCTDSTTASENGTTASTLLLLLLLCRRGAMHMTLVADTTDAGTYTTPDRIPNAQ